MNNYEEVLLNYQRWYLDLKDENIYNKKRLDFLKYHQESGITRVQIEPTQRCNYSCEMCPIDELDPLQSKKDMSFQEFEEILMQLPKTVTTICMSGLGEPFLNKAYLSMVKYAKEKGYIVEIYNNGSIFDKEILEFVDFIYFSVDAIDINLIQLLRKGVKYDRLFESISQSIEYRNEFNSSLKVILNFTISNKNYKEIPLLFDVAETLGVNTVQIQAIANNYAKNSIKYDKFRSFIKENSFSDWKFIIDNYNKNYQFSLLIWYPRKLKGFCNWTFSSLYITKDLNLISCCHKVTNPLIFGNLKDDKLINILENREFLDFKSMQIHNDDILLCDNCPF